MSNKLSNDINKLISEAKKFSGNVGSVVFNYEEQELIRRVFKSVFPQLKGMNDKKTAKLILNKTEWIDG
jgi:hypothetical protein